MSTTEQKEIDNKTTGIDVNPETEASVINILATIFNPISYMEPSTVRYNIERGCPGGMSKDDRSMRVELGNFIINHFAVIYFGLIANDVFRESIKEAVSVEIALDDKDEAFIADIRKSMKYEEEKQTKPSKGNYVVNFSAYNDDFYRKFNEKLLASFEKTSAFDDVIDDMARELKQDDLLDIGFIASNFMYLYRAVAKNEVFAHYIKSVVHSVEKELGLNNK